MQLGDEERSSQMSADIILKMGNSHGMTDRLVFGAWLLQAQLVDDDPKDRGAPNQQ